MARTTPNRVSRSLWEYVIKPGYIPNELTHDVVDLSTPLVKYRSAKEEPQLKLNLPFLSAAMQSVTGPDMAIAMAREGGLGVVYCSQPIDKQAEMVRRVKEYKAGLVTLDVFSPEHLIGDAIKRAEEMGYSTFPITDDGKPDGKLMGLLTSKDYDRRRHRNVKIGERMVPVEKISYGVEIDDLDEAAEMLIESKANFLPIVNRRRHLRHGIFRKDVDDRMENPLELVDGNWRYRVGAAINTKDYTERVAELVEAGIDVLFIEASHGFTGYQRDTLKHVLKKYPDIPIIGGNIVTEEGFDFLVKNGAHGVKIGMGPGSICSTREEIGVGRGQATAVEAIAEARNRYFKKSKLYVPIISDGGISVAKDVTVALALGADSVMMGRFLAGCKESPTKVETKAGQKVKPYWGEGSPRAREWREGRYDQLSFDEGVEAYVPYVGPLREHLGGAVERIIDGVRKAGCRNIRDLHENDVAEPQSDLSILEGRPHNIIKMS